MTEIDTSPHTIRCAGADGTINEDDPACGLTEVRAQEIDETHEWISEECSRDGCDGRRWFRRKFATTVSEYC